MIDLDAGCDPNGWCWSAQQIDRPVIEHYVDNPQDYYPFNKEVFAFSLTESGPVCRIYLPKKLSYYAVKEGWTLATLRSHELAHCAGLVHYAI